MARANDLYAQPVESEGFRIYTYADEGGLRAHADLSEIRPGMRFTFLVNAPLDVSRPLHDPFSYVLFLDENPVERMFLPQHYQLVHADETCGRAFPQWVETVLHSLSTCFYCNAIPAFDSHDVAGVLLDAKHPRLRFNLVPFDTFSVVPSAEGGAVFNRLLAVLLSPVEWGASRDDLEKLWQCEQLGAHVVMGGAFHPYLEQTLMLLGDGVQASDR